MTEYKCIYEHKSMLKPMRIYGAYFATLRNDAHSYDFRFMESNIHYYFSVKNEWFINQYILLISFNYHS